jgi:hypothetical protein
MRVAFTYLTDGLFVARLVVVAALCGSLFVTGCTGGNGPPTHTVKGTVTFQGTPVEEGLITFEDATQGRAGTSELGNGGAYRMELPDGNYAVCVAPPTIITPDTANSPGGEEYKAVANIPEKYWNFASSNLSAQVSKSSPSHDFDLKP